MKYSSEVYISALKALAALREAATERERATIDSIAEAIAEKGDRDKDARSNADKIRAMSDAGLAEFLCDFRSCDAIEHPCDLCKGKPYCHTGHAGMIDWLRQPAEEENHG